MVFMEEDPNAPHKSTQAYLRYGSTFIRDGNTSKNFETSYSILISEVYYFFDFGQLIQLIFMCMNDEDVVVYKETMIRGHDIFLDSLLQRRTHTKLYSYTHLFNGFAVHITYEKVVLVLGTFR